MQPGARFGNYEILSVLGKGGMGEVWRARDSTLRREVALKTLPAELARDPERLARLEREATLLAAVNHPNIAAIYGIEEHAGTRFLVLELVEGDTLADRCRGGPMKLETSLKSALQIAEALEAAHERGVIHRDLKPANIKLTPEGRIKVLDFGIAKALPFATGEVARDGTLRTELGTIIGTAPYMSPEQTRGEPVGRHTDIWSFGIVLFEMLTGYSPFERGTAPETIARVLEAQPDFTDLPNKTPPNLRHLLRRCLEKDQKRRLQHIGDARIEIEDALASFAAGPVPDSAEAAASGWRRRAVGAVALAVVFGGVAAWSLVEYRDPESAAEVVRLSIPSLPPPSVWPFGAQHLAISNDGSRVAYTSETELSIRRLSEARAVDLDLKAVNPFFSPDGQWLGFISEPTSLRKVPSIGGPAQLIVATTERPAGATWGPDGTIVFATVSGLYEVADDGSGSMRQLIAPDPERNERLYAWPQFMPDGKSILFTILPQDAAGVPQIAMLDLETLEAPRIVLTGGSAARYSATGHIVYAAGETLAAVAYDQNARMTRGEPGAFPGIRLAASSDNGAAEFAFSANGTLIHVEPMPAAAMPGVGLSWIDRDGREEPLAIPAGYYIYPRVSPDGTRVALDVGGANRDTWILDLRRASLTQLTNGPTEDLLPTWSPDGQRIFFASDRGGNFDIYSQAADGSSADRIEFAKPGFHVPSGFAPDGRQLIVFEEYNDLLLLELGQPELRPLLQRESSDRLGEISPDGNWIAYESDESGAQIEIFVRPFPDVMTAREKVSIDGGRYPRWGAPGSNELFYVDREGAMTAAIMEFSPSLRVQETTRLFDWQVPQPGLGGRTYDVSPLDGRFLVTRQLAPPMTNELEIAVVLNWFDELSGQVPPP